MEANMLSQSELWSESSKLNNVDRWFDSLTEEIKGMGEPVKKYREECDRELEKIVKECEKALKSVENTFSEQAESVAQEIKSAYNKEIFTQENKAVVFIYKKTNESISTLDAFVKQYEEYR